MTRGTVSRARHSPMWSVSMRTHLGTNVSPVPFPETAVSEGDNKCTPASVPNVWCQYAIVDEPAAFGDAFHTSLPACIDANLEYRVRMDQQ